MTKHVLMMVAVVLAIGGGSARATGTVAGGPLHMATGDDYACEVVNITGKDIASVMVSVTIAGSVPGSGATQTCAPLPAGHACVAQNTAGGNSERFCTVTVTGSKSGVRGTLCDRTKSFCVPLQ